MRKPTMCFFNRSDINQAVQTQKMAKGMKFFIYKVEELYYPCSENKGADQLPSYSKADLQLRFRIFKLLGFLIMRFIYFWFVLRALHKMSRLMGKPTICICENKDADQLRGNHEADQRLCFRYMDSTLPLLLKSEISSF